MYFSGDDPEYLSGENKSVSVLLVEDDAGSRALVKRALADNDESIDYDIQIAEDLSRAKELLSSCSFDNVLLDLCLPDSRGIETLDAIRDINPDVPVVVLSGLCDHETAMKSIRSGADYYIVKGSMLKEVLGRSICFSIERRNCGNLRGCDKELSTEVDLLRSQIREVKEALCEQVTCRNIAEEKLKKASDESKVLFDSLTAMIWHLDLDGKIIRLNKPAAELLDKKSEELTGHDFYELFADDADYLRSQFKQVAATGKSKLEKVGVFKTSSPFLKYSMADLIAYTNEDEKVSGFVVFAQSVTTGKGSSNSTNTEGDTQKNGEIADKFRAGMNNSRQQTTEKSTKKYAGKVLVVDDDSMNRMLVNINLRDTGVEVDFAHDGKEAVDKASGNSFDLIMTSLQMPGTDGIAATRQLRKIGVDTPVVIMSTDLRDEVMEKCNEAGTNAHIFKPINKKDVCSVLERFMSPVESL